jgi:hypothetical protein
MKASLVMLIGALVALTLLASALDTLFPPDTRQAWAGHAADQD